MVNRTHKGRWAILCQTGESPSDMARSGRQFSCVSVRRLDWQNF